MVSAAALCSVLIPGTASAAPVADGVAPSGFSSRNCTYVLSGDKSLKLDMCTLYYAYPSSGNAGPDIRFVVQLHSYKAAGFEWIDSTAQSLTVNSTVVQSAYRDPVFPFANQSDWGQDVSPSTCRHGSPDGPIGCSVANATRVDFYSARLRYDVLANSVRWRNLVLRVSWRDQYGHAHYWSPNTTSPVVLAQLLPF